MTETVFVIGGCRSGKSSYSRRLAEQIPGEKILIATCVPQDKEMERRIVLHQKERSQTWTTLEVPVRLPEAIGENSGKENVILIDCLTLWLNNIFMITDDLEKIDGHIQKLTQSLETAQCPVIIVSNEVGMGIVPTNRLARLFRDAAGFANQRITSCADRVIWMVAGIPVQIKPNIS